MANSALNWAFEQVLDSTAKFVLVALANRADGKSFECFPSLARIARDTGLNKSTVARALKILETRGLITRCRRRINAKSNKSTLYTLVVADCNQGLSLPATAVIADCDRVCRTRVSADVAQDDREPSAATLMESPKLSSVQKNRLQIISGGMDASASGDKPTPSVEADELWGQIQPFVNGQLDSHSYDTWVKPAVLFDVEELSGAVSLRFWAPNQWIGDWLSDHQQMFLTAAKQAGVPGSMKCQFTFPRQGMRGRA